MPKNKNKSQESAATTIIKFLDNTAKDIERGNQTLLHHNAIVAKKGNPAKKPKDLQPAEHYLANIEKSQSQLPMMLEKLKTNKDKFSENEYYKFTIQLNSLKATLASIIIQIIKQLADKSVYLSQTFSHNKKKQKEILAKASEYAKKARFLRQTAIANHVLAHDYDDELDEIMAYVEAEYENLLAEMDGKPLNDLLIRARNAVVHDNAYNYYQEAFELCVQNNNVNMQFRIKYEQARRDIDKLKSIHVEFPTADDIKTQQKMTRRICDAFIEATKIKLSYKDAPNIMNLNSEGIVTDLFYLSYHSFRFAILPVITEDFVLREQLLQDADDYRSYGQQLQKNINIQVTDFVFLASEIDKAKRELVTQRQKIEAEKKQKEEQEKLLAEKETHYNFAEILKKFPTSKPKTSKPNNNKPNSDSNPSSPQETESTLDIPEEEELIPIYITFEWQRKKHPKNIEIDLSIHLDLLAKATNENNFSELLRVNLNIAEYYRIAASRLSRKNITCIPLAIDQLEKAKVHLHNAATAIHYLKQLAQGQNPTDADLEDWVMIILKDTEKVLSKTLKRQQNIADRFNQGHDDAMNFIISKHGPAGWFKNEEFNWNNLSENAQIRIITNTNVERLTILKHDITYLRETLNQGKFFNKQARLAYRQQRFFNECQTKPRQITRTNSCESLLDNNNLQVIRKDKTARTW